MNHDPAGLASEGYRLLPDCHESGQGAVPESQLKICSIDHWGDEDLYTVFVVSSILTSSTIITVFDPPCLPLSISS